MVKIKRKIVCFSLLLFITISPPLQATHANTANPYTRNYTNDYLVKVLNLPDISHIVIDYLSAENENFTSLLDLTMILKYHQHAKQMIRKADDKQAALRSSAKYGQLDCVKYLVEQGADIHAKDELGCTALMSSAFYGHLDCLKYLVEQGAHVELTVRKGVTALHLSACHGHLDCVQYLHEQGAYLNAKDDKYGCTALHFSAGFGHLDCVQYLVEQGANVEDRVVMLFSPWMISYLSGHSDCAKYLWERRNTYRIILGIEILSAYLLHVKPTSDAVPPSSLSEVFTITRGKKITMEAPR